jgi:hypothetical protein
MTKTMIYDSAKTPSKEEIAERVAFLDRFFDEIHEINKTDPLPEDFLEYAKGRKFPTPAAQ